MKTSYLSQWEIQQMAEAALTNYELSCSWGRAHDEAREFAADEFQVRATTAQASTAVRIAQTGWEGIKNCVEKVTYEEQA